MKDGKKLKFSVGWDELRILFFFDIFKKRRKNIFNIIILWLYASLTIGLILSMSLENLWNVKNFES